MHAIDLNCDLGEAFGRYQLAGDEELMDYVSSVNVACGFHAGDPSVMHRTVSMALAKQVAIGAHPGLPDLQGFGRRFMEITAREAYQMILYQIGALYAFVKAEGARLHHVKPHGALYHMAATDFSIAKAIAQAVCDFDSKLLLYGLPGSQSAAAAQHVGLRFVGEAFADRRYEQDGSLVPRSKSNATIDNINEAIQQASFIAKEKKVYSVDKKAVYLEAETICIHGDGSRALTFAKDIRSCLQLDGIQVSAPNHNIMER